MDREDGKRILTECFRKYRWAVVVLLAGLVLMAMPSEKEEAPSTAELLRQEAGLQQQLEELLSKLQGAGKVKVLLTTAAGEQIHYQTDEDLSETTESKDRRRETVIITSADRSQTGLIERTDPPVYLGAVVLCQGAESPQVKLAVVDAVATATGLTSDKISVWKMK